jgi:exodeoxyribonuclease VII small subunit
MSDTAADNLSFEDALLRLEQIVRELEDGKTGLEEALAKYEQGVGLLKRCYGQLRQVEQRILEVTGQDADGKPLTRAFEHLASFEATKRDPSRG